MEPERTRYLNRSGPGNGFERLNMTLLLVLFVLTFPGSLLATVLLVAGLIQAWQSWKSRRLRKALERSVSRSEALRLLRGKS